MKRIMLLGGSTQQIPAITYAKEQGYYTVLCDYLSDNPGQKYADEYYNVSTTDIDAVLKVAKDTQIDGIVAYASDPAALTAAYVANKLDLPSNPYESVKILSRKDLFRNFLKGNGFNCPKAVSGSNLEELRIGVIGMQFPLIIKPVDSSGSKGVYRLDSEKELIDIFEIALSFSREKKVIVEEFIEMSHPCMLGGDIFIVDGKIDFYGFLNSYRDAKVDPYVPIGTSYPVFLSEENIEKAKNELQKAIELLDIKFGAFNIEIMFDKKQEAYIIEIGPRSGGNMIPDLLKMITGMDMARSTVEFALGNFRIDMEYSFPDEYYSTYVIHSAENGILEEITYAEDIKKNIISEVLYKEKGEKVEVFNGANKALGIVFLRFSSKAELQEKIKKMDELIGIQLNRYSLCEA